VQVSFNRFAGSGGEVRLRVSWPDWPWSIAEAFEGRSFWSSLWQSVHVWREGLVKGLTKLQGWAKAIKRDIVAIWIARKDPRVPWYVKFAAAAVTAYALSPIDLIPDFIPVLGYLDDLIVVPLGILLVVQMIPPRLMLEFREEAGRRADIPPSRAGVMMIIAMWVAAFGLTIWALT
jgi:uncharacterized membrane protein YkvA (DUF1232 family)